MWWKKQCDWWCAACSGQYNLKAADRVSVTQDSADRREAKVFQAHAAPQGMCGKMATAHSRWCHRAEEEFVLRTFIDTTAVGDSTRGPLLVDEDWHAL